MKVYIEKAGTSSYLLIFRFHRGSLYGNVYRNLLLRTVTYDDISEVARMWNFEKGEISLDRAKEAIDWMKENHEKNKRGKIIHICFAVFKKIVIKLLDGVA